MLNSTEQELDVDRVHKFSAYSPSYNSIYLTTPPISLTVCRYQLRLYAYCHL